MQGYEKGPLVGGPRCARRWAASGRRRGRLVGRQRGLGLGGGNATVGGERGRGAGVERAEPQRAGDVEHVVGGAQAGADRARGGVGGGGDERGGGGGDQRYPQRAQPRRRRRRAAGAQ